MRSAATLLLLCSFVFTGCGTARKVAVGTFRVIDAPANYVRNRIDDGGTQTTTTRTTTTYGQGAADDVSAPGYPVTQTPPPPRTVASSRPSTGPAASPRPPRTTTATPTPRPSPAATRRPASGQQQFPIARPVPGRPGYVYSVDPNGGIVDVTGYQPGDKAKDPYTKQIFIVP
ncbi:hypothetical protein BH20VER1_BH20VER1_02490 [soil metagenome]